MKTVHAENPSHPARKRPPLLGRVLTAALLAAAPAGAQDFIESFTWSGRHAATINGGAHTSVWWNEDNWDVRVDTGRILHGGERQATAVYGGHADPVDGRRNDRSAVGGDGGPGVGVMTLPNEGSMSARLRNPMQISAGTPGVVEFRAPRFNTTGHWWEVSITPANGTLIAGELTAMPSSPGYPEPMDSINVFLKDQDNNGPCYYPPTPGFFFSPAFRKSIGGVIVDKWEPGNGVMGDRFPTGLGEEDHLHLWRIEFRPSSIAFYGDLNEDGNPELLRTFQVTIPWSEVHVHLLGISYGGGTRHPEGNRLDPEGYGWSVTGCYEYPQIRDFPWKDIRIGPVKYGSTAQFPKSVQDMRTGGWLKQDIRDTLNIGAGQPNAAPYDRNFSPAFLLTPGQSKNLTFTLTAGEAAGIGQALLVYDVKSWGRASLTVNGTPVGEMPGKERFPIQMQDGALWWQRSMVIDPSLLTAGMNTLTVTAVAPPLGENPTEPVQFDRVHVEAGNGTRPPAPAAPRGIRFR